MLMRDGVYRYGSFGQDEGFDWDALFNTVVNVGGQVATSILKPGAPSGSTQPIPGTPYQPGGLPPNTPITSGGTPVKVPVVGHVSPTVLVAGAAGLGLIAFLALRR
jgi:hypothetical protein